MHKSEETLLFAGRAILISAYYCSPSKGSDWRVGWGRALQAARQFEQAVVLTSELSRADIEGYFLSHDPLPNLKFEYVAEVAGNLLAQLPKANLYINPFHYAAWQDRAAEAAAALHQRYRFDLVHQVNLIGYREPGKLRRLGIPLIWGPIGGMQNYPVRFLPQAGLSGAVKEGVRTLINNLQMRFSRKVRRAMRSADIVLAANSEAEVAIQQHFKRPAMLLLETGLDEVHPARPKPTKARTLRVLWSGDLQTRKALPLLLKAVSALRSEVALELRVLGHGPLEGKLRAQANRLGIADRCEFIGFLPLAEAMSQSDWADVFVFTSLRDTSGNVMLEAMSRGVPVVCLDHQGAHDIVTERCGIKIAVTNPSAVVRNLAKALTRLAQNPVLLETLSRGARERAKHYLWSENARVMATVYECALQNSHCKSELQSAVAKRPALNGSLSAKAGTNRT